MIMTAHVKRDTLIRFDFNRIERDGPMDRLRSFICLFACSFYSYRSVFTGFASAARTAW